MNPKDVIKKEDGLWAYYFCAQIANLFARLGLKSKLITPNLYTTISFGFAAIACLFFLYGYDYVYLLIGVVLLNLALVFDCADGHLARLKNMQSKFGHWYDYHSDKIKDGLILLTLTVGVFLKTGEYYYFIFAFIAIFFQFLR